MRPETRLQLRNQLRNVYQNLRHPSSKSPGGDGYGSYRTSDGSPSEDGYSRISQSDGMSKPSESASVPAKTFKQYFETEAGGTIENPFTKAWYDRVPYKTYLWTVSSVVCSIVFLLKIRGVHRAVNDILDMRQFEDARDEGEDLNKERPWMQLGIAFLPSFVCALSVGVALIVHFKLHQEAPHLLAQKERSWLWYWKSSVPVARNCSVAAVLLGGLMACLYFALTMALLAGAGVASSIHEAVVYADDNGALESAKEQAAKESEFVDAVVKLRSELVETEAAVDSLNVTCQVAVDDALHNTRALLDLPFVKQFKYGSEEHICFGTRCLNLSPYDWIWSGFYKICICDEDLDSLEDYLHILSKALRSTALPLFFQSLAIFSLVCCAAANYSFLKWRMKMEDGNIYLIPRSLVVGSIPNSDAKKTHHCYRKSGPILEQV